MDISTLLVEQTAPVVAADASASFTKVSHRTLPTPKSCDWNGCAHCANEPSTPAMVQRLPFDTHEQQRSQPPKRPSMETPPYNGRSYARPHNHSNSTPLNGYSSENHIPTMDPRFHHHQLRTPLPITFGIENGITATSVLPINRSTKGKRPPPSAHSPEPRGKKKKSTKASRTSKWSPTEDAAIIEMRHNRMKWEDIAKCLPGRSALSCRLRFQNYLERRMEWNDEKKDKLARLYERFKKDMWEKIAKEMQCPWRAAEALHWELGKREIAHRANVPVFHLASSGGPGNPRDSSSASSSALSDCAPSVSSPVGTDASHASAPCAPMPHIQNQSPPQIFVQRLEPLASVTGVGRFSPGNVMAAHRSFLPNGVVEIDAPASWQPSQCS